MKHFLLITLIFCFAGTLFAEELFKDPQSRKKYPTHISHTYNGKTYKLEATGATSYRVMIAKIYSTVHYMENPEFKEGFEQFYDPNKAKMNMNTWFYEIDDGKFRTEAKKSFQKYGDISELEPLIDEYLGFFKGGVSYNDRHTVWWLPGGVIEVYVNDELQGTIKNENFARTVWQNVFGAHSNIDRNELISRLTVADKDL